jgi:hypothetical protein
MGGFGAQPMQNPMQSKPLGGQQLGGGMQNPMGGQQSSPYEMMQRFQQMQGLQGFGGQQGGFGGQRPPMNPMRDQRMQMHQDQRMQHEMDKQQRKGFSGGFNPMRPGQPMQPGFNPMGGAPMQNPMQQNPMQSNPMQHQFTAQPGAGPLTTVYQQQAPMQQGQPMGVAPPDGRTGTMSPETQAYYAQDAANQALRGQMVQQQIQSQTLPPTGTDTLGGMMANMTPEQIAMQQRGTAPPPVGMAMGGPVGMPPPHPYAQQMGREDPRMQAMRRMQMMNFGNK